MAQWNPSGWPTQPGNPQGGWQQPPSGPNNWPQQQMPGSAWGAPQPNQFGPPPPGWVPPGAGSIGPPMPPGNWQPGFGGGAQPPFAPPQGFGGMPGGFGGPPMPQSGPPMPWSAPPPAKTDAPRAAPPRKTENRPTTDADAADRTYGAGAAAGAKKSVKHRLLAQPKDGKFINWDVARARTKAAVEAAWIDEVEPWALERNGSVAVRLAMARPPMGVIPPRPKG